MSTSTTNGIATVGGMIVREISIEYDEATDTVTVTPGSVDKGTTVRFVNPKGSKVRIAFLSPTGKRTDEVLDSEVCTLTIGGTYHFKCSFIGTSGQISPESGGVFDVIPQRP